MWLQGQSVRYFLKLHLNGDIREVFISQFTFTETHAPHIQRVPSVPAGPTISDDTEGPTAGGVLGEQSVFFWTDNGL